MTVSSYLNTGSCSDCIKHCLIALSVTIEGDELVAQMSVNSTLRGGHVPLNTWAQIAVQHHGNRMVVQTTLLL